MLDPKDDQVARANAALPARIILHIGMTKAGSTAIQNAMEKNYKYLLEHGILFPKSIFSRLNPYYEGATSGHLQLFRDLRDRNLRGFVEELEKSRGWADKMLLSAENIFQDLEESYLDVLARLLKGKTVDILIILRSQVNWVSSRYFQSVVRGDKKETRSFNEFVESLIEDGTLNYHQRLFYICDKIEPNNVIALDYDWIRRNGGAVSAASRVMGLERLPLKISDIESNVSFPYPERIEAHRRLNISARELSHGDYMAWCAEMERLARKVVRERGLNVAHIQPDSRLRQRIQMACLESNRNLSTDYLGGRAFKCTEKDTVEELSEPNETIVGELTTHGLELMAPYIKSNRQRLREQNRTIQGLTKAERRASEQLVAAKRDADTKCSTLERRVERLTEKAAIVQGERDAFIRYAEQLERKYLAVLKSRSWKIMRPYRLMGRLVERLVTGRRSHPNRLPKRPSLKSEERKRRMTARDEETIQQLRLRLLNLGFVDRAKADLIECACDESRPIRRRLAARELTVWYVNQTRESDVRRALTYLPIARDGENDGSVLRKLCVLEAEAWRRLGKIESARQLLREQLDFAEHADVYLALATLENDPDAKIDLINQALRLHGLHEVILRNDFAVPVYDRLSTKPTPRFEGSNAADVPMISVIMPAYNSERTIGTAIDAIINQTWENLELIVVDDCSQDDTVHVVEQFCKMDPRVRLVCCELNAGPYVARNVALQQTQGQFVTCNDADDWSHPQKLEIQVRHLIDNPDVVANHSQQARATQDLDFYRRGNMGVYVFANMSSFMFRREPILNELGYWDSVRFSADAEFIRRARLVFGNKAVATLSSGPLSFQRQSSDSLTGNSAFGYHGFFMGARLEYFNWQGRFHSSASDLRYDFPMKKRPFPVPEPLWPRRERTTDGRRHFDMVVISEFRPNEDSALPTAKEIEILRDRGIRMGFVQMCRYTLSPTRKMKDEIACLVDGNCIQVVVYGEQIRCDLLVIVDIEALQDRQRFIPHIEARDIRAIVNKAPMSKYTEEGVLRYELPVCARNVDQYFGGSAVWHPCDSEVRQLLLRYHQDELSGVHLSETDCSGLLSALEVSKKS